MAQPKDKIFGSGSHLNNQNAGFVSIFSVLIIATILTLIIVGFSAITRRAQTATLNNQLNTQAFYAAESGVNDAIAFLRSPGATSKTQCQGAVGSAFFSYNNSLDPASNTGYTCVLVNSESPAMAFSDVPVEGTAAVPIITTLKSNNGPVGSFNVTWGASSGPINIPNGTTLLSEPNWVTTKNNLGILRIDLVASDSAFDRASLTQNDFTFFLYPTSAGATNAFTVKSAAAPNSPADQGEILYSLCAAGSTTCTANITLNPNTVVNYTMRLQSIYADTSVSISGGKNSSGTSINWVGGQAVVDSTGKASDVFRRIQVFVPITAQGPTAPFVVQSGKSICKILQTTPAPGGTIIDPSFGAALPADNPCFIN